MRRSSILISLTLIASISVPVSADSRKPSAGQTRISGPTTVPIGPSGTWTGKQGDMPQSVQSGWGAGNQVYALGQDAVFHSSDRGVTWEAQELKIDGKVIWGSAVDDVWVMGTTRAHSTDQGKTWEVSKPFGEDIEIYSVWGPSAKELYAVGKGKKTSVILYSKDGGKTFKPQSTPLKYGRLYAVVSHGNEMFVAGYEAETEAAIPVLVVSKDKGKHWKRQTTAPKTKRESDSFTGVCFTESGKLVLSLEYEVYVSSDDGKSWKSVKETKGKVLSLACSGQEIFVSGTSRTFYHSRDEGATWGDSEIKDLFIDQLRTAMNKVFTTDGGDVYVGGDGIFSEKTGSLFRRAK